MYVLSDMSGRNKKTAKIEIRCEPKTHTDWRHVVADFKDAEIAMQFCIGLYTEHKKKAQPATKPGSVL